MQVSDGLFAQRYVGLPILETQLRAEGNSARFADGEEGHGAV